MSSSFERANALSRIDAIEIALKRLLAALEARQAPADSVERAMAALEALPFDAASTVEAFQGAPTDEVELVKRRLQRVASLDSVVRAECERMLATTTLAIERTRVLKANLDALAADGETGAGLDVVR